MVREIKKRVRLEFWRPVVGYEGVYEISNWGNIKRIKPAHGTRCGLLAISYGASYPQIGLHKNGKQKTHLLHLLILNAFVGPKPTPDHECSHIDGNKKNHVDWNLEWSTHSENEKHSFELGKTVWHKGKSPSSMGVAFKAVSPSGKKYYGRNIKKFCKKHKLENSCACRVLRGESKTHKDWRFYHV